MDYLQWQSSLSAEDVFIGSETFAYPELLDDGSIIYLTALKDDKNRSALVRKIDDREQVITPKPYHLQTQISEYGGKPFWLSDDHIIFANRDDQCLYLQSINALLNTGASEPVAISASANNEIWRYTDIHVLHSGDVIFIAEYQNTVDHTEQSFIGYLAGAINALDDSIDSQQQSLEPVVLVKGADFYSNLVVDEENGKLAWVQWNHPNMPWDDVDLCSCTIDFTDNVLSVLDVGTVDLTNISSGAKSVCQLMFASTGDLFFSADFVLQGNQERKQDTLDGEINNGFEPLNYWQVYRLSISTGEIQQLTSERAEYGYPHWVYGDSRIAESHDGKILVIESKPSGDRIVAIDQDDLSKTIVFDGQSTLQSLSALKGTSSCLLVSLPQAGPPELTSLDLNSTKVQQTVLKTSSAPEFDVSRAEAVEYSTRDGAVSHGFYYAPFNKEYELTLSQTKAPPLLVMVHGGPTARAYGHYDVQKQFWTSRGFAIFDVNHRGSSGYGRAFRDALYGHWGDMDASDIIDGVEYLIEQGKADPERICIRGKSAGGYAVLRALTEYPDRFKAGANYYGIGNLVTLANSTHKFEKYYCDQLLGETFDNKVANSPNSRYHQRSPINKVADLNSSMIIFQGLLDKVVPPQVAQELVKALEAQQQTYSYVEYADEGHGFRQSANNIDAWNRELAFYKQVLSC